jgi:hypothetical protein
MGLDFALRPLYPLKGRNAWTTRRGRLARLAPKKGTQGMPLPDGRPTASEANHRGAAGDSGNLGSPYILPSTVVVAARDAVAGLSRRGIRRRLAAEAQATYLAIMDPKSCATTRDRLSAADGAAKVAGLFKERVDVRVSHSLGFKGFQAIEGTLVVDAVPLPTVPASTDGAKSGG